ncbi:thiamine-binding protein [Dolosigranulum pigrum]|uniref:thiamine-binding protein n=1 Tax=Dolosigranulum pigrum TaxID=29394 RepID=UPI001C65BA5C|nr:thiamine-binding protein [Dolosigranulum pigrum]
MSDINTLVAVSIAPIASQEELAPQIAEVIRVIRSSHLPNQTYSMFTEIEGPWDEVMAIVKEATQVLTDRGIRTIVNVKADVRPGHSGTMKRKVEKVNRILNEETAK